MKIMISLMLENGEGDRVCEVRNADESVTVLHAEAGQLIIDMPEEGHPVMHVEVVA